MSTSSFALKNSTTYLSVSSPCFWLDTQPDLIIITEHGLSQENLENTRLDGYTLLGGFTRKTHVKGGMAGYAENGLEKHIKFLGASNEESELICETALFEVKLKKETIRVLGVYRPPRANLEQAIEILSDQLEHALRTKKPTVIMGDININNLDEHANDSDNNKLEELLTSFDLTRLNLPPTRITHESKS
ncbi:hypothetical protein J6590_062573 [Homalodisca vitripennis]|nr:hypothetical protein J6590_062573 [Homalodisca vitripennis]